MNRKITYARLHQNGYAPGVGELGNTFPPQSKTLEGLSMEVAVEGLYMTFLYKGIRQELLVPLANIIMMTLAPEDTNKSAARIVKSA